MKRKKAKHIVAIGSLVLITAAAMAYARQGTQEPGRISTTVQAGDGVLTLSGNLTQDKVLQGGDGVVGLSLTLRAGETPGGREEGDRHVDMVVVLDRSGSMSGEKITHARQAVLDLLSSLTEKDRFALVSYADSVRRDSGLGRMTAAYREQMESVVREVSEGGGTNLGAGLQEGIDLIRSAGRIGNAARVILISDGLANVGITDPQALGQMASQAVAGEFAVTTVGVGSDFNEVLMTALADRGTGNYYYLANPNTFASVFQQEFRNTRMVAASSVEIRVPLGGAVSLVEAGGYPIEVRGGAAVIRPGDILSGQARNLFLSLKVPTDREADFLLHGIAVRDVQDGAPRTVTLDRPFHVACIREKQQVFASIDAGTWEEKVLQEDFNKLREDVANDIRSGEKDKAQERIREYRRAQESINDVLKSEAVAENLRGDLGALQQKVEETFEGDENEVHSKQKENAKSVQFGGYLGRRGKQ